VAQALEGEALLLVLGLEPHPLQQGLEVTMVEVVVVHGLAHAVRENKAVVFALGSH
jgi:hypothetical protein